MPAPLDFAIVAALLAWGVWDHVRLLPAARREVAEGRPGAKLRVYRRIALAEWLLAAVVLAAWAVSHRPLPLLGLVLPSGWRLLAGAGLAVLVAALGAMQSRALGAMPREALAARMAALPADVRFILPASPAERRGFLWLSLTAGVCEELLVRGFLMWFIGAWTGPWWAALISSALFGLGHAYQGVPGVIKTGLVGLVMAAIYLLTGSLLPGMLVHALIDMGSGEAAARILGAAAESPGASPAPTR